MGILDKIFVVKEDDQSAQDQSSPVTNNKPAQAPVQMPQNVSVSPAGAQPQTTAVQVMPDMALVESFYRDLVDENDVSGNYYELKKNADALASMGLTEQQRFQAALKIIQAAHPGITKDDMLRSVDSYLRKMEEISSTGETQCDEKMKVVSKSRKGELDQCDAYIAAKLEKINQYKGMIDQLNAEIDSHQAEKLQIMNQQSADIAKLQNDLMTFRASVDHVRTSLANDKNIINLIQ